MKTKKIPFLALIVTILSGTVLSMVPVRDVMASPLYQSTVTPGAPNYCPATATGTSIIPTLVFPTFSGFPTSPFYPTSTPCPPGVPCPTVTSPPTVTPTKTVTPTPTATTTPILKLQVVALVYTYNGPTPSTNIQYSSVPLNGYGNDLYYSHTLGGNTGNAGAFSNGTTASPTGYMTFKNVSGGPLVIFVIYHADTLTSGVDDRGGPWSYYRDPDGGWPQASSANIGGNPTNRDIMMAYNTNNNDTITIYSSGSPDRARYPGTYSAYTSFHVTTDPLAVNPYTPTPIVTPTATATGTPAPCIPGGEDVVLGGNPIINGDLNPVLTGYDCYTIVPELMVTLPSLSWAPFDLPAQIGIPGIQLCISFYSFSLTVFNLDVMAFLAVACSLIGAGIVFNELRR